MSDVRLYQGDCLSFLDTIGPVDALVTDPPYGLGKKWSGGSAKWPLKERGMKWDALPAKGLPELVARFERSIVWGGHLYGLPPARGWLVWDKIVRKFTSGHCELAWTNLDQPIRAFNFSHGQLASEGKVHPTQKPLRLMEWCLSFLPEGCTVLDPYMGSGTTGVACINTGRNFIGIESDPVHFATAEKRIAAARAALPLFAREVPA